MIIFPLSIPGKIVLILVMIVLGLIFYGMMRPGFFQKLFRKGRTDIPEPKAEPTSRPPKVRNGKSN